MIPISEVSLTFQDGTALPTAKEWRRLAKSLLSRKPPCSHCGAEASCVDHVVPRRVAPNLLLDLRNLQVLCSACHGKKWRYDRRVFMPESASRFPWEHGYPKSSEQAQRSVVMRIVKGDEPKKKRRRFSDFEGRTGFRRT